MSEKYEISGTLKVINDKQTFASGFTKREFVIQTNDDKYPQLIKFEATKESCGKLDLFEVDDEINVQFNIRGNEYNGKYYVSLHAWKFEAVGNQRVERQVAPKPQSKPSAKDDKWIDDATDDIPF
jgi:hypothetical protein